MSLLKDSVCPVTTAVHIVISWKRRRRPPLAHFEVGTASYVIGSDPISRDFQVPYLHFVCVSTRGVSAGLHLHEVRGGLRRKGSTGDWSEGTIVDMVEYETSVTSQC